MFAKYFEYYTIIAGAVFSWTRCILLPNSEHSSVNMDLYTRMIPDSDGGLQDGTESAHKHADADKLC